MKEFFTNLFKNHKWTLLLIAVAVILGILILTINFWRTLLLTVLISIAVLFGYLIDKGGLAAVKAFFASIFSKKR